MFIKKDHRRIDEIINDSNDEKSALKLSKRSPEFQGNIFVLCKEPYIPYLKNLRVLNLYDNSLTNLQGIGLLSSCPLEELNLGGNKLDSLPNELGQIISLTSLWLDDNNFEEFPLVICKLSKLRSLRISGNSLKSIPDLISSLQSLEILAIDNNEITDFPKGILTLSKLTQLWLRQNNISIIPDDIDNLESLQTFSISSNKISNIPESISSIKSLKFLYANCNKIISLPSGLCFHEGLKEIILSNNLISTLPHEWLNTWGEIDHSNGELKNTNVKILMISNPVINQ